MEVWKCAPPSFSGFNSASTCGVERLRRLAPSLAQSQRRRVIGGFRALRRARELGQPDLGGVKCGERFSDVFGDRRQLGDARLMLARRGPQREEALLGFFEIARIEIRLLQRGFQRLLGERQRVERLRQGL